MIIDYNIENGFVLLEDKRVSKNALNVATLLNTSFYYKNGKRREVRKLNKEKDLITCLKKYTLFKNITERNIERVLLGLSNDNEVDIYAGINIIVTQELFKLYNKFCQSN